MATLSADQAAEICALGVVELGKRYRAKQLSPVTVTQAVLDRINRLQPTINAFQLIMADSALAAAKTAEAELAAGIDLGPMHGIPVSVKDIINVKGTRTTANSRVLLEAPLDEQDATVVRRLRSAGAVLVGKTKLYEFAWGEHGADSPFGRTQNPRKIGHMTSGSSTGSAAATTAGLGVASIGSCTGGSIRIPASFMGIVGLKPSCGLVSVRGVIPLSPYMDHLGPLTRSVADAAATLAAIAGYDPLDPYSVPSMAVDYMAAVGREIKGLRLGIPTNEFFQYGQEEPLALVEAARNTLVNLGMIPVPLEMPRIQEATDAASTCMSVEGWLYHQRYDDKQELYGANARGKLFAGKNISAYQYSQAKQSQFEIRRLWQGLFDQADVLAVPSTLIPPPRWEQTTVVVKGETIPPGTVTGRNTRQFNFTGLPAMAIPIGDVGGLPIGMQLVGPPFGEARLIAVGHALEQALGNLTAKWGIEPKS